MGDWTLRGKVSALQSQDAKGLKKAFRAEEPVMATGTFGSIARLAKGTIFALPGKDATNSQARRWRLVEGTASFEVKEASSLFSVRIDAAEVRVLGTQFTVQVEKREGNLGHPNVFAKVVLYAGTLEIINPHGKLQLLSGDVALVTNETAPQKSIEGLATRFGRNYEPIAVDAHPSIPAYGLPLTKGQIGNYRHVAKKIKLFPGLLLKNGFCSQK